MYTWLMGIACLGSYVNGSLLLHTVICLSLLLLGSLPLWRWNYQLITSAADGHLSCSPLGTITNSVGMSTFGQV